MEPSINIHEGKGYIVNNMDMVQTEESDQGSMIKVILVASEYNYAKDNEADRIFTKKYRHERGYLKLNF